LSGQQDGNANDINYLLRTSPQLA